ncbi:MAG TPA: hypothetical protein VKE40_08625 [Gemmataceae bacterium]|nr:hypothetical protein [Gemmataceae bacterium]
MRDERGFAGLSRSSGGPGFLSRPPAGMEARWLQTIPGRDWFAYFRIYGPQGPAFDGSWKPGDFEELK